ncbi:MAG TPA: acyl-CoA dehydrogenase family protein [Candidatus Binataceae bacterium]|nr:acyl-CoA dehydrogenase family protein [Candidatus Binataceae bacterium]
MAIDFTLSDQQRELQAQARAFARSVLGGVRSAIAKIGDPGERFYATRPFYREMARAGFAKSLIPAEYGGSGLSTLDLALAAEELAAVDVNVPTTLLATGLGLQPVLRYGNEEQRRRFLPDFVENGEDRLAAFAFTEVTGGANYDSPDPSSGVRTFARRDGDQWVISGHKHYTTNGTGWDGKGAHLYTVICRTDLGKPPQDSLAVIAVPGNSEGIRIEGMIDTLGHRAVSSPRIRFDEVRVPAANILGRPGDGAAIISRSFAWTAALIGAACTGVMRAAFECALGFARADKRSGPVPVIEYQNVGYMLADLKMRIEAARYLTWKACHYFDSTGGAGEELPIITKVYCSELAVQVVYDAMRLVGIDSYTDMQPLAGLMQDVLAFPLYDGGNMGVRRRQLHALFRRPGYDPMAAAEGRPPTR